MTGLGYILKGERLFDSLLLTATLVTLRVSRHCRWIILMTKIIDFKDSPILYTFMNISVEAMLRKINKCTIYLVEQ